MTSEYKKNCNLSLSEPFQIIWRLFPYAAITENIAAALTSLSLDCLDDTYYEDDFVIVPRDGDFRPVPKKPRRGDGNDS